MFLYLNLKRKAVCALQIATLQMDISDSRDKEGRCELLERQFAEILKEGRHPDLVILPELWGCGFFAYDRYIQDSEDLRGATFSFLASWALRLHAYILGGSIVEAEGEALYNTSLLIDRDGELEGSYRKIHLFGFESQEQKLLRRGEFPVVIPTNLGCFGLSTCYDLRFPEQYRAMVDLGADIFLVPAAWPAARIAHWRLFNQARALENQSWLISCNCAGEQNGSQYGGNSMVVSPTGEIIAVAEASPVLFYSEVDLGLVRNARESFPALADRQPLN